jgi:HlyD family secretion protein
MTANVQVPVDVRKDALRVPNAALRFRPDNADLATEARKDKATGGAAAGSASSAPASSPPAPGTPERTSPPASSAASGGRPGGTGDGGRGAGAPGSGGMRASAGTGTLYVEVPNSGGKLKPVTVKTLITDGNLTAIRSDDLKEGDEIIVGLATARAGMPGGGSPGAPGGGRRPF